MRPFLPKAGPQVAPISPMGTPGRYRLGQVSESAMKDVARNLVSMAEPRVRAIVSEERTRLAEAAKAGIPFLGFSAIAFLTTQYFVPSDAAKAKIVGYVASGAALAAGVWWTASQLADSAAQQRAQSQAPGGAAGLVSQLTSGVSMQMAQAVVQEAEPKVRQIVDDEQQRLARAIQTGIPWAGAGAVAAIVTAFLVPDDLPAGKAAGYAAASLLGAFSLWKTMDKTSELSAAPAAA